MLKTGDIVIQDCIMVNNILKKERQLSVVLFERIKDGNDIIYTCPITNSEEVTFKNKNKYCYFPYLMLDENRDSCVEIDGLDSYDRKVAHPIGIQLDKDYLDMIYKKVIDYEVPEDKRKVYQEVKEAIDKSIKLEKEQKKQEKRSRKILKKLNKKTIRN